MDIQGDRAVRRREAERLSRRSVFRLAGAGAAALAVTSGFGAAARAQPLFPGRMRVLHGAPDLGKVEVLFNDDKVLDEFEYGKLSDWEDVDPGLVRITVRRDRLLINDVVFDASYAVVADEHTNIIISDPLLIPAPVDRAPLPQGSARMRLVQASIDTPAFDVVTQDGTIVIPALEYGQQSDSLEFPIGTQSFEIRLHETGEVLIPVTAIQLENGMVYDLIVYGVPGDDDKPLTLAVLTDQVRVVPAQATPTA